MIKIQEKYFLYIEKNKEEGKYFDIIKEYYAKLD